MMMLWLLTIDVTSVFVALEWNDNTCDASAAKVPVGIEGDTGGNSLACRIVSDNDNDKNNDGDGV